MKLWNKTLLASALCLTLFGCDDASKVDNKLDKAKDNGADEGCRGGQSAGD